jgi:hypothetical protein
MSQEYAFTELRRNAGTQFDPAVVEAFVDALTASGERYGSPVEISEDEARRRAERGHGQPYDAIDRVRGRLEFPRQGETAGIDGRGGREASGG